MSVLQQLRAADARAVRAASRTLRRAHATRCTGYTQTWNELLFASKADYTAVASTSSDASLLAGTNDQPILSSQFFREQERRTITVVGRGVFSTTGTPTMTWTFRLGTTSGSTYLSGTTVLLSAAITTGSGVSNKVFQFIASITCNTSGIGTGNTTLSGAGMISSPGGFASPFSYALTPGGGDSATFTSTHDDSLTQYMNVSLTWSASSSSNTATLKQLLVYGER